MLDLSLTIGAEDSGGSRIGSPAATSVSANFVNSAG